MPVIFPGFMYCGLGFIIFQAWAALALAEEEKPAAFSVEADLMARATCLIPSASCSAAFLRSLHLRSAPLRRLRFLDFRNRDANTLTHLL